MLDENALLSEILVCSDPLGVMLGNSGITLLLTSLKTLDVEAIEVRVNDIIDRVNDFQNTSLSNGLTGLAFLLTVLDRKGLLTDDGRKQLQELDELLIRSSIRLLEIKNFDYLHGYLGIANYLIFKNHTTIFSRQFLTDILSVISRTESNEGIPIRMDLGLAHGLPSVLSTIVNLWIKTRSTDVYEKIPVIQNLILGYRSEDLIPSLYPSSVIDKDQSSRLAWCYGDLGINISLLKSAQQLRDKSLINRVLDDLVATAKRTQAQDTDIKDCSFCHGAAGCLYIYDVLFQKFGKVEFKTAADFWRQYIHDRYSEDGLDGLRFHLGSEGWILERGLLEGLAGIFLALYPSSIDTMAIDYLFFLNDIADGDDR